MTGHALRRREFTTLLGGTAMWLLAAGTQSNRVSENHA